MSNRLFEERVRPYLDLALEGFATRTDNSIAALATSREALLSSTAALDTANANFTNADAAVIAAGAARDLTLSYRDQAANSRDISTAAQSASEIARDQALQAARIAGAEIAFTYADAVALSLPEGEFVLILNDEGPDGEGGWTARLSDGSNLSPPTQLSGNDFFEGTTPVPVSASTPTVQSASFGPKGDADHRLVMRTGQTIDGRSYLEWRDRNGQTRLLLGSNASSDFIVFVKGVHRLIAYAADADGNGITEINSLGTHPVTIGMGADNHGGTGGLIVGTGGAEKKEIMAVTAGQIRMRAPIRMETAFNHLPVTATDAQPVVQTPAGTPYIMQYFIGSTLQWRQTYGTDGSLRFRNGLGDRVLNLSNNDRVGIGSGAFTPTAKLDVAGTTRSRGVLTCDSDISAGGSAFIGGDLNVTGQLNISNLPTSAAGLSAGDIWNNAGTLSVA